MTSPRETASTATAAAAHDRLAAAYQAQRERSSPPADMWSNCAGSFKPDLTAPLSPLLERVASYLLPGDVLLDVGGGAGRLSLPLAGRCAQIVCIDPSPAMRESFSATAADAGITNASFIAGGWLDVPGVQGDVALVAHVTYFVTEIVPFVEKLNASVRRVIIATRTVPPPNQVAPFFELVRGEALSPVPGHRELLAVLGEMGIEADVVDLGEAALPATAPAGATREDAIRIEVEGAIRLGWLQRDEAERAAAVIGERFEELFTQVGGAFRRRNALDARDLLITWERAR